jgi:hydrogenase expression/formation protein HypC
MCLAIPGKLLEKDTDQAANQIQGRVDYDGVIKVVNLSFVPEAVPGDFVVVHAGFAITVLDEKEAQASLKMFDALKDAGT